MYQGKEYIKNKGKNIIKSSLKGMIFFITLINVYAQEEFWVEDNSNKKNAITLEESVIRSEYIEIDSIKSTKNVKVINREEIENKGYNTLTEVLGDIPTINVSKTGYGEIDIRGQGSRGASRNVQIMVDGAPINSLTQHPYKTDYNIVPVSQIEKIEIIEGGGSVLYGSGTSGGVINITTNLKTMSKPLTSVGYEFESANKKRYFANAGANITDDLVLQFNYSGEDSDLYFVDTYKKTNYFGAGFNYKVTDKQSVSLKYSYFDEVGNYIYNLSKYNLEKFGKNYKPEYARVTVGYDDVNKEYIYARKRRYNQSNRQSQGLKLSHLYQITDNLEIRTDLFQQLGEFRNSHYEDKDMKYDNLGGKVKLKYKYLEDNRFLIGVDYYNQESTLEIPRYKKGFSDKFNYKKNVTAIFAHNLLKINQLEFTQGIRKDITTWENEKPIGPYSKYQGTNKKFEDERDNLAYELSSAWVYRDTGRFFLRYEKGFTTPDGIQMTDESYVEKEKLYTLTDADDEIYDTYEIGLRDYILGSYITTTIFMTATDNELQRIRVKNSSGKRETKTLNLLETQRYGFEITAEQKINKLTFFESYGWLKGKTDYNSQGKDLITSGSEIDWSDSGLQKVPEHSFVIGADYKFTDNFNVGATVKYVGGYTNYFNEAEKTEDSLVNSSTVTDLRISYKIQKLDNLSIYGGINNMFDYKYYNYVSTGSGSSVNPANERTYYVGVKYKF